PGAYTTGEVIEGLNGTNDDKSFTYHAGTKRQGSDTILTNGGRVLGITGKGKDAGEAISRAYERAERISWKNHYYRRDIGKDILQG
ncbi:MAG TPA: phosphoribosylglycinamide synthetase C domain-containing protein, partial [Cyclobacteriaceae bacterium]|nr:phosphoribosylglycinamide synthetase C domain-containing protein [Cyclobacteriaceae bacterium]